RYGLPAIFPPTTPPAIRSRRGFFNKLESDEHDGLHTHFCTVAARHSVRSDWNCDVQAGIDHRPVEIPRLDSAGRSKKGMTTLAVARQGGFFCAFGRGLRRTAGPSLDQPALRPRGKNGAQAIFPPFSGTIRASETDGGLNAPDQSDPGRRY